MAGKRLLDAAKLFGAARSIAKQHANIRAEQWEIYSQTSSLAKAVKSQTDRFTVTAGAAYAIAKRLSETEAGPVNVRSSRRDGAHDAPIPRQESRGTAQDGVQGGLDQDHHYRPSEQNSAVDPAPQGELNVAQEKPGRYPLADGTIPSEGAQIGTSGPQGRDTYGERPQGEPHQEHLSRESGESELGVAQEKPARYPLPAGTIPTDGSTHGGSPSRQGKDTFNERPGSEAAPDHLAERGSAKHLRPVESDSSTIPSPAHGKAHSSDALRKMQRQAEFQIPSVTVDAVGLASDTLDPSTQTLGDDTVAERSKHVSAQLSSLPRVKIPKTTADSQGTDEHVSDRQINQDVFYSADQSAAGRDITSMPAKEEVNTEIFHSPRVSSLLSSQGKDDRRKAYEAKMNAARKPSSSRDDAINAQVPGESNKPAESEQETRDFAQTLAADVMGQSSPEVRLPLPPSERMLTVLTEPI